MDKILQAFEQYGDTFLDDLVIYSIQQQSCLLKTETMLSLSALGIAIANTTKSDIIKA